MDEPRKEFLDLALSCGAKLTGKPDGTEAITVVFTIDAWRAFDAACLTQALATTEPVKCPGHSDGRHVLDEFGGYYAEGCTYIDTSRDVVSKPATTERKDETKHLIDTLRTDARGGRAATVHDLDAAANLLEAYLVATTERKGGSPSARSCAASGLAADWRFACLAGSRQIRRASSAPSSTHPRKCRKVSSGSRSRSTVCLILAKRLSGGIGTQTLG